MKKKRILGYISLLIVPIVVACSVGRDNSVIYLITGKLRESFLTELTQNYWTNFKKKVSNPTNNQEKVYRALLKEDGVGVNLTKLEIIKLVDNGTTLYTIDRGTGIDESTRVLYDCQGLFPRGYKDLSDEDKKKVPSPDPTKCNENNEILKSQINGHTEFYISITYTGGKLARNSDVPKNEKVQFCVYTTYSYDSNNKLITNIKQFNDGVCN